MRLAKQERNYFFLLLLLLLWEKQSTTVAAKDQALSTNCFKKRIMKEETESECRLCKEHEETTDHLTSLCPILV
jgi:hypothetical protein